MKDASTIEVRQRIQCGLCGAEYVVETIATVGRDTPATEQPPVWCAFCGHRGRRAVKGR